MNISMFDILGPIMIGPSSSHTAGAQRIGKAMYTDFGSLYAAWFLPPHSTWSRYRPCTGRRCSGNERK